MDGQADGLQSVPRGLGADAGPLGGEDGESGMVKGAYGGKSGRELAIVVVRVD